MATQKWIAGGVSTYTSGFFGTEINSLVNGNAVQAGTALDNTTNLDTYADISISLGSVASGAGAPYIGFWLYPLNQDTSTYGDGAFGSSAAGPPPGSYFVGQIPVIPSVTAVIVGTLRGILLPPSSFKFVLVNQAGVTLASSSNTVKWKTYNLAVS